MVISTAVMKIGRYTSEMTCCFPDACL